MARNLALSLSKQGYPPLSIFNRTVSKMDSLLALRVKNEDGEEVAVCKGVKTLEEMGRTCDVIFTSLSVS